VRNQERETRAIAVAIDTSRGRSSSELASSRTGLVGPLVSPPSAKTRILGIPWRVFPNRSRHDDDNGNERNGRGGRSVPSNFADPANRRVNSTRAIRHAPIPPLVGGLVQPPAAATNTPCVQFPRVGGFLPASRRLTFRHPSHVAASLSCKRRISTVLHPEAHPTLAHRDAKTPRSDDAFDSARDTQRRIVNVRRLTSTRLSFPMPGEETRPVERTTST